MKKLLMGLALIILVFGSLLAAVGCEPEVAPGAYPGSLVPTTNATQDIGTSTKQWRNIYLSGTPVIANHSSGTANISSGSTSVNVNHDLGGTATQVFLTYAADPFTTSNVTSGKELYWTSVNATAFAVYATGAAANITLYTNWLAFKLTE